MSENNKIVLGYWDIRGLAEPSRLALQYKNVPFDDKLYHMQVEGTEANREEWLKEKFHLGLDFPNLPYLFDGDLKMTQSKPILFYLGRKFDLMGKSLVEEANVMMLCDEAHDLRMKMSMHFYGPNGGCETSRKEYFDANVRPNLKRFDEFLAKNSSKFSVGDSATVADFQLFDYLDVAFLMDGSEKASTDFPHIHVFLDHMRNLPELKDYILKSQATFPINAAIAKFGNVVIKREHF